MMEKEVKNILNNFKLLEVDWIKKEVDGYINECKILDVKYKFEECIIKFTNGIDLLYLGIDKNMLSITKYSKDTIEVVSVSKHLVLNKQVLEIRDKGVLYKNIKKRYINSNKLLSISEDRYVFTNEVLEKIFGKIDNSKTEELLLKIKVLELSTDLKKYASNYTSFITYKDKYPWENKLNKDNKSFVTKTYLNGVDISNTYNLIDNQDKLLRIYYLYQGIIDKINEIDIDCIAYGLVSTEAFNLLELNGIKANEDELIGSTKEQYSDQYINYIRELLGRKYNYLDEFIINREDLLKAIVFDEKDFQFYPLEYKGEMVILK